MTALVRLSEPWRDRTAVDRRPLRINLIVFVGGKTSKFGFANASLREGGGIFAENDEGSLRDVRFLLTLP